MNCEALVSRVQYCLENIEMRKALNKINQFAKCESQIEAAEYMVEIKNKMALFDALIQWVKVIYATELKTQ